MQVFGYGKSEWHWVTNPPQVANLPHNFPLMEK